MRSPASCWALALAACLLAAAPAPTRAQGDAAVPADPLPEDVQLLFDIELRGPAGGPTNLLPWTTANEAVVAEVLCRGYLPAADCSAATIEVLNVFTFLAPAPADAGTAGGSSRRLLQGVVLPQQAERQTQRGPAQRQRQRPVAAAIASPAEVSEQQRQQVGPAPAPVPAPAITQQRQVATPAPAPAVVLPGLQREATAAPQPAEAQQELADAPAPAKSQAQRRREAAAAEEPVPAAEQPGRRREAAAAEAPVPAAEQPGRQQEVAVAEAPAPAAEQPGQRQEVAAADAPAPAAQPGQRAGKAGKQRQERQQEGNQDDARSPTKEQAPPEEMVSGTGVELKITLPSKLGRAATELDAVEGAITVGKLAQDLTAAGLVVESATLVAAYVEEPAAEGGTTAAAAWEGGAPAGAPDF